MGSIESFEPETGYWERLIVVEGDICCLRVDAIVNAASEALLGGGGVDGAIHRAAGPALLEACRRIGGCPTGEVRLTPGFRLPATFIIHAVGPVWQGGDQGEARLLAACYRRSLVAAAAQDLRTIAFPAISCGAFGYPLREAATVAVGEALGFLATPEGALIEQILLVCRGDEAVRTFGAIRDGAAADLEQGGNGLPAERAGRRSRR